ncbi:response regulator, partial [bacterium]|nr:response regulator [bacterium]
MNDKIILLVDDDKNVLNQISSEIKKSGFKQILTAKGADDAWVTMRKKEVDCIICALEMSEMSGLALLKIIRREDSSSDLPFFLTDNAFTKLKVLKAGQIGVTGLFVTPCKTEIIKKKILVALKNKK